MSFKACKNCGRIIPKLEKKCPYCGSESFSRFSGAIFIRDPEHSEIAKIAEKKEKGIYAINLVD